MCQSGRLAALAFLVVFVPGFAFSQQPSGQKPKPPKRGQKQAAQTQPAAAAVTAADKDEKQDEDRWKGLTWRLIGPYRGGRVIAVAGVPGDPTTYYFGAVAGGIWKSTDGGTSWKPVADKEKITSIGDIAVSHSDPNVIYAGTGESCIRGNITEGDGVYKSTDAGKSWKYAGLRDTRHIGRVIVHPKNSDVVFVAALGHAFGPNQERGVFRSTDGGKNWEKVLYKDENTGAIDITFDPSNPNVLFAALWQARRQPWGMESGGPGSGVYRSSDGGSTWKRLEGNGLPSGIMGRIGVAVSANPNRVWALIEAEKGGLYRSDDGGEKWTLVNDDRRFRQRAWYYTHLYADPKDPDKVYILNVNIARSTDGGKTFTELRTPPHVDHHGLWIDPTDPRRMINGNDGGANVTVNGGESWTAQEQPTAQFYHVTTDNRWPYYIYGAQQDNSTIAIPSRSDGGAITAADWYPVGGCESGYIAVDPRDHNIVYAGCYGGHITRFDKRTGQEQEINAWPENPMGTGAAELKHRFQWTAPIVISPHDPNVLYHGGEVLFKSTDGGMSWTAISPDLTRNDKSKQQASGGPITKDNTSVEYYSTIFTVAESPKEKGTIWVGSDDGLVHITRDGGNNWSNVTPKNLPEWGTVSLIEASPHDAGTAYVAVDRHRLDDFKPYIFKTSDYGKSWRTLTDGLPKRAAVRAVREDPARKGLLYAGTERGVFVSWEDGARWSHDIQTNLPMTPIHDLVVKDKDLVVATHGRSFWILDDLSPLRQFAPEVTQANAHLFKPAPAIRTQGVPEWALPRGAVGQNPPSGAVIYYYLKTSLKKEDKKTTEPTKPGAQAQAPAPQPEATRPEGAKPAATAEPAAPPAPAAEDDKEKEAREEQPPDLTVEILDARGSVIRKYPSKPEPRAEGEQAARQEERRPKPLPADAGLNRFVWDLRYESAPSVPGAVLWGGGVRGPMVPPGNYQVRVTAQGKSYTAPFEVRPDPRVKTSQQDFARQFDLRMKIHQQLTRAHQAVNQMRDVRKQIKELSGRLGNDARHKPIVDAGKDLDKKMTAVEEEIIQPKSKAPQDPLNYPIKLNDKLAALGGIVDGSDTAPTKQAQEVFDSLSQRLDAQLLKWNAIRNGELAHFNELVKNQNVPAVIMPTDGTPSQEGQGR